LESKDGVGRGGDWYVARLLVDLLPVAGGCEVRRQVKGGSTGIWLWGVCGGGGGSERQWGRR